MNHSTFQEYAAAFWLLSYCFESLAETRIGKVLESVYNSILGFRFCFASPRVLIVFKTLKPGKRLISIPRSIFRVRRKGQLNSQNPVRRVQKFRLPVVFATWLVQYHMIKQRFELRWVPVKLTYTVQHETIDTVLYI